jgi:hypothetical protein
MLPGVGECLLHDAIGAQIDTGRQRHDGSFDREAYVRTRSPSGVYQIAEAAQAGLRRSGGVAGGTGAHDAQESPHLGEGVTRRHADGVEALLPQFREPRCGVPGGLGLNGDHRQVMRHHVVSLTGDAGALLRGGLLPEGVGHGVTSGVALGDHLTALAPTVAQDLGRHQCDQNEEAGWSGVFAVERGHGVEEDTADHLIVIGRGRLIADASVRDVLAAASDDRVAIRTPARAEAITVLAGAGGCVASTDGDTLVVTGLAPERVAALVVERGLPLHALTPHRASLEDAYMELTRDAVDYSAQLTGDVR